MCQDLGDASSVERTSAAGPAVADVLHAGFGTGVLDEDLATDVGDDDLVPVGGDQDVSKPYCPSTL